VPSALLHRYLSNFNLAAHCVPVSATASRQHVRSATSHQLVVPSYRLSSYGRRSFSVAGPATCNSLVATETFA